MSTTESFILYESVYKQFERFRKKGKDEIAVALIDAVMRYGLYDEMPDEDDDVWDYGLDGMFASIKAAKERRAKNISDGKGGGRPKTSLDETEVMQLKARLGTWKAVAQALGVDEKTLRREREEWENGKNFFPEMGKTEKREKPLSPETGKTGKRKNLTVTVTDTFTETATETVTALAGEKMEELVRMYRDLDSAIPMMDDAGADEVSELLDNGLYFSNPEEKLRQMAPAELEKVREFWEKYCG